MKISIRRSGGDVGHTAASHNSPLAQAVLRLTAAGRQEPLGADLCYEIRVEEGGNCRTFVLHDSDPPVSPALRELLGFFEPAVHKVAACAASTA